MRIFERSKSLIGEKAVNLLQERCVCLFGVGGVGGFVAESLVRSGVGSLIVVDGDVVKESNFNRQIIADINTLNKSKVEVLKRRLLDINPNLKIRAINCFYLPETADTVDLTGVSYIVDAVDTVTAKIEIIKRAKELNIPVISCMGTGGKTDILSLKVADISKTEGCPLARVMRRELKARGIQNVKVVYSKEQVKGANIKEDGVNKNSPSSMIFVPATAGLLIAKEVVFDLTKGV